MFARGLSWALLFCLLFLSPATSYSLSVKEEAQAESLILRLEWLNLLQRINDLKSSLKDLRESDQKFIDDLKKQLAEQRATLAALENRLTGLTKYIAGLETENLWLKIGLGAAGVVVLGVAVWALMK